MDNKLEKIEIPALEEKRASFKFRGEVFEYTCPNELAKRTEKTFQDLNGILFSSKLERVYNEKESWIYSSPGKGKLSFGKDATMR